MTLAALIIGFVAGSVCGGVATMLILSLGYTAGGKETPQQESERCLMCGHEL